MKGAADAFPRLLITYTPARPVVGWADEESNAPALETPASPDTTGGAAPPEWAEEKRSNGGEGGLMKAPRRGARRRTSVESTASSTAASPPAASPQADAESLAAARRRSKAARTSVNNGGRRRSSAASLAEPPRRLNIGPTLMKRPYLLVPWLAEPGAAASTSGASASSSRPGEEDEEEEIPEGNLAAAVAGVAADPVRLELRRLEALLGPGYAVSADIPADTEHEAAVTTDVAASGGAEADRGTSPRPSAGRRKGAAQRVSQDDGAAGRKKSGARRHKMLTEEAEQDGDAPPPSAHPLRHKERDRRSSQQSGGKHARGGVVVTANGRRSSAGGDDHHDAAEFPALLPPPSPSRPPPLERLVPTAADRALEAAMLRLSRSTRLDKRRQDPRVTYLNNFIVSLICVVFYMCVRLASSASRCDSLCMPADSSSTYQSVSSQQMRWYAEPLLLSFSRPARA